MGTTARDHSQGFAQIVGRHIGELLQIGIRSCQIVRVHSRLLLGRSVLGVELDAPHGAGDLIGDAGDQLHMPVLVGRGL
ncbi:MAG: hypothetical protein QGI09_02160, partial [Dehalococcoidia bacterium]|nr:hypothetical protein [Dehalococcoidia bacterium]